MSRHAWTRDEVDILTHLAGNCPGVKLANEYNKWAKRNGFPVRTTRAIIVAANRRGISYKAQGEWLKIGYISTLLGCSGKTPLGWIAKGLVPSFRSDHGQNYIRRRDLVTLAKRQPEVFAGMNRSALWALLEDHDLADAIVATYPRHHSQPKPVVAVEARKRFPSISAAAALVYISPPAIRRAIRTGGTAAGYHWTYAS